MTIPVHASVITNAMFAGMAFGLPLHWAYYWVCVPVIVLAGSIPISPQGAGVMEAFAILLTRRQGVIVARHSHWRCRFGWCRSSGTYRRHLRPSRRVPCADGN